MENVNPVFAIVGEPSVGVGFVGMSVTGPTGLLSTGVPLPLTFVAVTSTRK
jgi:hypothetical protein